MNTVGIDEPIHSTRRNTFPPSTLMATPSYLRVGVPLPVNTQLTRLIGLSITRWRSSGARRKMVGIDLIISSEYDFYAAFGASGTSIGNMYMVGMSPP